MEIREETPSCDCYHFGQRRDETYRQCFAWGKMELLREQSDDEDAVGTVGPESRVFSEYHCSDTCITTALFYS